MAKQIKVKANNTSMCTRKTNVSIETIMNAFVYILKYLLCFSIKIGFNNNTLYENYLIRSLLLTLHKYLMIIVIIFFYLF